MANKSTFLVRSVAGPNRNRAISEGALPFRDEHAAFIVSLIDEGFVVMGGPVGEDGGGLMIVHAESEEAVRLRLGQGPWYQRGVLALESVKHWALLNDARTT